ncbi:MAG: HesA/MoeB/ThiF family protein [Clostridia bacterium]
MKNRYTRNIGALTADEQQTLFEKTVLVVGLGGLGGYDVEYLARLGIGEIRICDYDVFDESNLNRQLVSNEALVGKSKVEATAEHIKAINSDVKVVEYAEKFTEKSASDMLYGVDIVLDALDSVSSRFALEAATSKAGIPLVYAALSGYEGQITTIMPEKPLLKSLYKGVVKNEAPSVMPFTPAAISAYQVSEAIKVLLGRGELFGWLLLVDLDSNVTEKIHL